MLVLSRKINESIIIDDDIKITIVEIRGDKVRLGIEAPRERSIHRQEVYEAIQEDNRKKDVIEESRKLENVVTKGAGFGSLIKKIKGFCGFKRNSELYDSYGMLEYDPLNYLTTKGLTKSFKDQLKQYQ